MKIHLLLPFIVCFGLSFSVQARLTITLLEIPATTPLEAPIYIAGNFNGWNAGDPAFQLQTNEEGLFEITLPDWAIGQLAFKFTRGPWWTVEGNEQGTWLANHTYFHDGIPKQVMMGLKSWEDLSPASGFPTTAAPNVHLISTRFYIPQLDRLRRIWIYLPPDYYADNRRYPVLYLHDAQNAFDQTSGFSGEWQVDETLNRLYQQQQFVGIVVGIDNGGSHRINEYSPWTNQQYGGGEGDELAAFIVETLKPFIDRHYKTLPDQAHTGVMGSSLGGLLAHYMAVQYQEVFGRAGIFSPSYWFSEGPYQQVGNVGRREYIKFYFVAGRNESAAIADNTLRMERTLESVGFDDPSVLSFIHPDGSHAEWYWAREFEGAYKWLFH
jgi:enterochelin esterase-like enzyme